MSTLKINIPEGYKIGAFNTDTGEVTFAPIPKDIKERIKTFADVLEYHELTEALFYATCEGLTTDEVAYRKVKLLTEALNEVKETNYKPDWNNGNWDKWFPWFNMPDSSGRGFSFDGAGNQDSTSRAGSRLCFKTKDLAVHAGETFTDIYNDFFTK